MTGDNEATARRVAGELGISSVVAERYDAAERSGADDVAHAVVVVFALAPVG